MLLQYCMIEHSRQTLLQPFLRRNIKKVPFYFKSGTFYVNKLDDGLPNVYFTHSQFFEVPFMGRIKNYLTLKYDFNGKPYYKVSNSEFSSFFTTTYIFVLLLFDYNITLCTPCSGSFGQKTY